MDDGPSSQTLVRGAEFRPRLRKQFRENFECGNTGGTLKIPELLPLVTEASTRSWQNFLGPFKEGSPMLHLTG